LSWRKWRCNKTQGCVEKNHTRKYPRSSQCANGPFDVLKISNIGTHDDHLCDSDPVTNQKLYFCLKSFQVINKFTVIIYYTSDSESSFDVEL